MTETQDPFAPEPDAPTGATPDPFEAPEVPAADAPVATESPQPTDEDILGVGDGAIEDEIAASAPDAAETTEFPPGPLATADEDQPGAADEPQADTPPAAEEPPLVNREGDVQPPAATTSPETAPAAPEAPVAPPAGGEQAATATSGASAPPADDVAPATGPRGGRGEMRLYKLLYQTGPAAWTEVDLAEIEKREAAAAPADKLGIAFKQTIEKDRDNNEIPGTEQCWMLARNNEHANRISFAILGRPKDGVMCFPIPRGSWKPKTVKPAPPKPDREALVIS